MEGGTRSSQWYRCNSYEHVGPEYKRISISTKGPILLLQPLQSWRTLQTVQLSVWSPLFPSVELRGASKPKVLPLLPEARQLELLALLRLLPCLLIGSPLEVVLISFFRAWGWVSCAQPTRMCWGMPEIKNPNRPYFETRVAPG